MSAANAPAELRQLRQWIVWRSEIRDGKPTKVPYRTDGRTLASSTDRATWATFDAACAAAADPALSLSGVGFVFSKDDPYCGIDLDDCIENGTVAPWAQQIIDALGGYSEISPSGTGAKVWVRATLGDRPGRHWHKPREVECYDRGRYFTLTGNVLPGSAEFIPDAQAAVDAIYTAFEAVRNAKAPRGRNASSGGLVDVAEVVRLASSAANGAKFTALWNGDFSAYPSRSEADLALISILAFYIGPDAVAIEAVARQSGLNREKWDRDDYLPRTIARALGGKTEFYGSSRASFNGGGGVKTDNARGTAVVLSVDPGDQRVGARPCTDLGNAERFAKHFAGRLRFCHGTGKWLFWDGQRWSDDDEGAAVSAAAQTARDILAEAQSCDDASQRKSLADWAIKSESRPRLDAMVALAKSQRPLVVRVDDLDADDWLLNVKNGTIDLRSGSIRPHDSADLITKLAPTTYDPEAECPRFMAFLDRIFAGNTELIGFVQRWLGLSLSGNIDEQVLPVFHGPGANGKSVLIDTDLGIMGDYATIAPPYLLTESKQREHPTEIADLRGRRFVPASETEEGSALKLQLVKRLTGDQTLKGRHMRQDYFEFRRTHKLVLVTNNKPRVRENSEAVWRRIRLVPFIVVIPERERDLNLMHKLKNEWPGILSWLVQGCLDWQREGLGEPAAVIEATSAYRQGEDAVGRFLEERCVVERPPAEYTLFVPWASLWSEYVKWAEHTGERRVSVRSLGAALDRLDYPTGSGRYGGQKVKGRPGIGLRDDRQEPEFPK